jgi:hypothetical protein
MGARFLLNYEPFAAQLALTRWEFYANPTREFEKVLVAEVTVRNIWQFGCILAQCTTDTFRQLATIAVLDWLNNVHSGLLMAVHAEQVLVRHTAHNART